MGGPAGRSGGFGAAKGGFTYAVPAGSGGGGGGVASVTAGNASITIGGTGANPTVAINLANANTWTAAQTVTVDDAGTTTVVDSLAARHTSSGTPGVGFGSAVLLGGEDASGNADDIGRVGARWVTATSGAERSETFMQARPTGGGALVDVLVCRVNATSAVTVFTGGGGDAAGYHIGTTASSIGRMTRSGTTLEITGSTTLPTIALAGTNVSSGAVRTVQVQPGTNTGQTASTEINGFAYLTATRTWATGAIASQREVAFNGLTYAFAAASTITAAATLYATPPIAGTNATITNAYSAWFSSKIRIDSEVALGGGAPATLGTIGGSGPATLTQAGWVQIDTQNGPGWTAVWR